MRRASAVTQCPLRTHGDAQTSREKRAHVTVALELLHLKLGNSRNAQVELRPVDPHAGSVFEGAIPVDASSRAASSTVCLVLQPIFFKKRRVS